MTDERNPQEVVEDLDVPADDGDQVKGGITDGTSNTIMVGEVVAKPATSLKQACASGKHFPEVKLTS